MFVFLTSKFTEINPAVYTLSLGLASPIVGSIKSIYFIVHPSLFLWIYVVVGIHDCCVIKGGPQYMPSFVRLETEVMGYRDRFGTCWTIAAFRKVPSICRCHVLLMEHELVPPDTNKDLSLPLATLVRML